MKQFQNKQISKRKRKQSRNLFGKSLSPKRVNVKNKTNFVKVNQNMKKNTAHAHPDYIILTNYWSCIKLFLPAKPAAATPRPTAIRVPPCHQNKTSSSYHTGLHEPLQHRNLKSREVERAASQSPHKTTWLINICLPVIRLWLLCGKDNNCSSKML